jgi:nucleoside-diphosphate-sugar epimerase
MKLLLLVTLISVTSAFHIVCVKPSRFSVAQKRSLTRHRRVCSAGGIRELHGLAAVRESNTNSPIEEINGEEEEESAFDKVASMGLAGVLAIAVAESIFWALGVPLAALYYKFTTGEWIDMMTTDGQLKAAGFSFGYGGFATVILQYRVTLFAIPLVPVMDKLVVQPGKKWFGEEWGKKSDGDDVSKERNLYSQSSYTIIGATSGVGQCIAKALKEKNGSQCEVKAVSRNVASASQFPMLEGCELVEADTRDPSSLPAALEADFVIISVGTTAFPTKKWQAGQNKPKTACLDSVANILETIKTSKKRPKKIVLISSIGVERRGEIPFSVLNTFGVLDYKKESEELLKEFSMDTGIPSIVVRPGRLVGAPFTNTDLAALLRLDQGSKKGVLVSREDDIAGDTERNDVATVVLQALETPSRAKHAVFSVVNEDGSAPAEAALGNLLLSVMSTQGEEAPQEVKEVLV